MPEGLFLQHHKLKNPPPVQEKPVSKKTIPFPMKALCGVSPDRVRVHYDSSEPGRWHANAMARGYDVYMAPGKRHLLFHELAHVTQNFAGLVAPNISYKNGLLNQEPHLERQADRMAGGDYAGFSRGTHPVRLDVAQMQTEITYIPGTYYYNYDENAHSFCSHDTVGKEMKATLDPNDPKQGSTTAAAWGVHKQLMERLKEIWNTGLFGIVRGHLLNDHLGGQAIPENLFPIARAANACHLYQVEGYVKHLVYNGRTVQYDVTVYNEDGTQDFNEDNPRTIFHCEVDTVDSEPAVHVSYNVESDISKNSTNESRDISAFRAMNFPFSWNLPGSPWNPSR